MKIVLNGSWFVTSAKKLIFSVPLVSQRISLNKINMTFGGKLFKIALLKRFLLMAFGY